MCIEEYAPSVTCFLFLCVFNSVCVQLSSAVDFSASDKIGKSVLALCSVEALYSVRTQVGESLDAKYGYFLCLVVFSDQTYYIPDSKVQSEQYLNWHHLLNPESFKCWCYLGSFGHIYPHYTVEISANKQRDQEKILYKNDQGEVFQRGLASNLNLVQLESDIHHMFITTNITQY